MGTTSNFGFGTQIRKSPVRDDGSLGVQVTLTRAEFEDMRSARN